MESIPGSRSPNAVSSLHLSNLSDQFTPRMTTHGASGDPRSSIYDMHMHHPAIAPIDVVMRLQALPLTGQVVAWAWDLAAEMAQQSRKAPPVALLAALWPATAAVVDASAPQDLVEIVQSWLILIRQWPKHFIMSTKVVEELTSISFPSAIKRMSEERLVNLVTACRDIALHRADPMEVQSFGGQELSARELMQPIFALSIAEIAWRAADPDRTVAQTTIRLFLSSSDAWRWKVNKRDNSTLASIKIATQSALDMLRRSHEGAS